MLVGRGPERRVIDRLLAGARVGDSGVLLVIGDPGIGKTALLVDAEGAASGMRMVRVRGAAAEREVPFGGLQQLCAPFVELIDRLPGPQVDALGVALALRRGPSPDRFAVGAATLGLLSRAAEDRPVAVLLDDAHLLDRSSAEAITFAARRLVTDPVAVLVGIRSGEPSPLTDAGLPELALTGVDLAAARRLVIGATGDAPTPARLQRLHQATAGNPLALIELSADFEQLELQPVDAPAPLTGELLDAFAKRAAGLTAPARAVLLLAATDSHDLTTLDRACAKAGLHIDALSEAEKVGLVRLTGEVVEFRHPLVQAAVYGAAAPGERRTAHRTLAAVMSDTDADRRPWHLAQGAIGPDEPTAAALERAAAVSASRGAHAVAGAMLERAAGLTPDPQARGARLLCAGERAWLAGRTVRAQTLLDQAGSCPGSALHGIRVHELQGAIAARCGSLEQARDTLMRAARQAADVDPERAVVLLADAIDVCLYLCDTATALSASAHLDVLLAAGTSDRGRVLGSMAAGMAQVLAGHGDRGAELIRDATALLADTGALADDPLRLAWMVLGPLFLREKGTARDRLAEAVDELRDLAAVGSLPFLLFHIARDDATTDRWTQAEAWYAEAVRIADETGQTTDLAASLAGLAWLQARVGKEDECREAASRSRDISDRNHVNLARAWTSFAMGDLEAGLGNQPAAGREYEALLGLLHDVGLADPDLSPAPELVEVWSRVGQRERAVELAGRFHLRARAKGQPWALARAHRALAIVGDDSDADGHFEAALDLHADTPDSYERARTELAFGARLRRMRRRTESRPRLTSALTTFEDLGARPWADLAAIELKATGRTVRRRGLSVIHQLTPQERQIAHLLAAGRTTRQTAAALFLSPKTVEYHLRNVYIKLGIHSRDELAAAMEDQEGSRHG